MITSTSDSRDFSVTGMGRDVTRNGVSALYVRYFFVAMGILFFGITALGFVPQLWMVHVNHVHLHWFTHVHGGVMTLWLLLFLLQSSLAAKGQLKFHRRLGIFSACWGVVVGTTLSIVTLTALVRDNPPEESMQFATLALSIVAILLFGLFFCWGISARRNAAVHKRLVFLAMLPLMSAGIDRIGWLPGLQSAYFVRLVYLDLLLIPLLVYDFLALRRIHRITVIGAGCLLLGQAGTITAVESPAWYRFVYGALTPFVERVPEVVLTDAQSAPLVGDYGGRDWKMTISRDGAKLYLQIPDQPKWTLGATSETELFVKRGGWKLSFVKDSEGRVAKVINTHPDHAWEAAKIGSP